MNKQLDFCLSPSSLFSHLPDATNGKEKANEVDS